MSTALLFAIGSFYGWPSVISGCLLRSGGNYSKSAFAVKDAGIVRKDRGEELSNGSSRLYIKILGMV